MTAHDTQRQSHRWLSRLVGLAALTAVGIASVYWYRDPVLGWLLLNVVLLNLFGFVTTVVHESGHALVAGMLGMKVLGVRIGSGTVLCTFRWWGVPVELRVFAVGGGITMFTHPTGAWARLKHTAVVAAGPTANLMMAATAIHYLSPAAIWTRFPPGTALFPMAVFIAVNLLVFAVNLIPRQVEAAGRRLPSDGLQLLRLLFRRRPG